MIGHVGAYCHEKNQSFLIDVFNEISKQKQNAKLLLAGKGEDEALLRGKVSEYQLSDQVIFVTDCLDARELYQAMDVFVLTSLFDGIPVAAIEAQANGLPCIFSDSISREAVLTDTVIMMSLFQPVELWADIIMNVFKYRAKMNGEQLRMKGYEVKGQAVKLEEWYGVLSG